MKDFELEELNVWKYTKEYFLDLLNGITSLEEMRENLASFRNTEHYTGNNPKYKKIQDDEF